MQLVDADGSVNKLEGINDVDSGLSEAETRGFYSVDEVVIHGNLGWNWANFERFLGNFVDSGLFFGLRLAR